MVVVEVKGQTQLAAISQGIAARRVRQRALLGRLSDGPDGLVAGCGDARDEDFLLGADDGNITVIEVVARANGDLGTIEELTHMNQLVLQSTLWGVAGSTFPPWRAQMTQTVSPGFHDGLNLLMRGAWNLSTDRLYHGASITIPRGLTSPDAEPFASPPP